MRTKVCSKCNKEKEVSEFYKETNSSDGLQYYCKECINEVVKKWRGKHPEKVREWCQRRSEKIRALKDKACSRCGKEYPYYVMEFHHPEGTEKEVTIANETNSSFRKALEEAKKCKVVCANCHRIIHHGNDHKD